MRNNPQYGLEAAIAGVLAPGPFPVRSAKDKHQSPSSLPSAPLFILNIYFLVFHLLSLVLINVDSVSHDLFHFHVGRGEGMPTSSPSVEMVSSMSCGSWLVDVPTAWFCAWICWEHHGLQRSGAGFYYVQDLGFLFHLYIRQVCGSDSSKRGSSCFSHPDAEG